MSKNLEKQVVVIDDDEIIRLSCSEILKKSGYHVETFENGHEGIARIDELRPQILVVDIMMPELNGFQVMELVRQIDPDLVIVVITGYATLGTAVQAMKAGAYDFLPKPFTPEELRLIIGRGYERWRLTKESQRLRREKAEIERRFVTFVSHQLKSPLAAVKQYLDVLLFTMRAQLPEKALAWIERCQLRLDEMLSLIHDWLALAKIERGALCQKEASADVAAVLTKVVKDYLPSAAAAGVTISTDLQPDLPAVKGDPVSLDMLFSNLVGNAIKYNRAGGTVAVTAEPRAETVCISVSDSGIGIPEEWQEKLFTEFFRVKTAQTQHIPGTGLGLAICKKIIAELGGSLTLSSKEGVGTTFVASLPLAASGAES